MRIPGSVVNQVVVIFERSLKIYAQSQKPSRKSYAEPLCLPTVQGC